MPGQCIPASAIIQFRRNVQRKNSAHHFRMQSEREQTLELTFCGEFPAFVYMKTKNIVTGHLFGSCVSHIYDNVCYTKLCAILVNFF